MPQERLLTCADCPEAIWYSGSGRPPERCTDCKKARAAQHARDYQAAHREELNAYLREYKREWRKRPPSQARRPKASKEEVAARSKAWREANPDKDRAAKRRYRQNNPEKGREQGWRQQGIDMTWDRFLSILWRQAFMCANPGCDRNIDASAHVDHCHATRLVRGILCGGCNAGAGQARDDPGILRGLAEYLEAHS